MIGRKRRGNISKIESRAFLKPKTGKIAIKIINHCGDEVLKVFGA
jgi:adenine-specific DNA-methyltransferase